MPETILVNDFRAGWCPSDDEVNGRPNALLRMTNLELDQNGALQLIHGTEILWSGYSGVGFRMYSRFIGASRFDYVACNDGSVWRNNNQIITGGNVSIAAFGTAYDFVLICSGTQKFKDSGFGSVNLGVGPPTVAPTITQANAHVQVANIGNMQAAVVVVNGAMAVIAGNYDQCTTDGSGLFVMQSVIAVPVNCTVLSGPDGSGTQTDDDFVIISGYIINPVNVSLEFDVLLKPGDPAGDLVTDMYTFVVQDLSKQANFDTITGAFTINIKRNQFNRLGGAALDWSTVYGFRLTINTNTPGIGGTVINIWGSYMGWQYFVLQGGTGSQFGTYQYAQVNVNNTGSYVAKSTMGPASNPITLNGAEGIITGQVPTDPQVNQVWIYRKGGNLGGTWYRVAVVNPPYTFPVYDITGDQAALDLNITWNINLISVASIPHTIFEIVGPIEGRWYYFTDNFMYPSEHNDPDLVDPSIALRTTGANAEVLMWARAVSASVVLVGTDVDCYLLTGTFSTFPDGTIDVYYQSLGVKFPPVTFDAEAFGGAVYYLAADGWRFVLPTSFGTTYSSQNNQSMVAPNLDTLYRGGSPVLYGYIHPVMPINPASVRFPICIAKNKMWCFPGGTGRGEVWDFQRQYWRAYIYGSVGGASACTATQDNKVIVFSPFDNKVREHDYQGSKLIDFSTQQTFDVRFTYKDNGKPRQRKDLYTFKSRCYTGVGSIHFFFTDEQQNFIDFPTHLISSSVTNETYVDLAPTLNPFNTINPLYLPKSIQVQMDGTSDDVVIQDWSIDFDSRPVPLTFLRIYPTNFGSATQKRLRTWPLVIDTLGNDVVFTPDVDGVMQAQTHFNSNYKKTQFYYFTTDAFGIDYGGTLHCDAGGMMEVWDTGTGQLGSGLQPNIVQNLPIGTMFDQVGPLEIFRFGKIARMALRVASATGGPMPFSIYVDDVLLYSDQFNINAGEDDYVVDLPKGVSGRILRVTYGPCGFVFNRYYSKFQVAISGSQQDTELRWLTVPGITSTIAQGL